MLKGSIFKKNHPPSPYPKEWDGSLNPTQVLLPQSSFLQVTQIAKRRTPRIALTMRFIACFFSLNLKERDPLNLIPLYLLSNPIPEP